MSKRGAAFRTALGAPRIPRSAFDLSSERKFTADMFQLIPVFLEDVIPGDNWKIGAEMVVRMNPMAVPIMHEINASIHYFFLSYRLIYDKWRREMPATRTFDYEEYYTGGEDGLYRQLPPMLTLDRPTVETFSDPLHIFNYLYSFLPQTGYISTTETLGKIRIDPIIAYNLTFNEYYRDQNVMDKVSLTDLVWHYRSFEKDYFTSALPWQQRGTAPALPVAVTGGRTIFDSGTTPADDPYLINPVKVHRYTGQNPPTPPVKLSPPEMKDWLNNNHIQLEAADTATFDVNTLRLTVQTQKWLERNATTGARFTEHLQAHAGTHPPDGRLQRPEYIGGMRTPVIISEVLQTSETTNESALGTMGGHGITADRAMCASKFIQEPGLIIGIMSIMPVPLYMSQGIDRQWTKQSRFDEYMSEFVNLGEQAIKLSEVWNQQNIVDPKAEPIFGYQGRFNEYRYRRNTVHGLMLTDLAMWHMGRKFATRPYLNKDFVTPNASERLALKRGMAAPPEPAFLVHFANRCPHVVRPLPWLPDPGRLDH